MTLDLNDLISGWQCPTGDLAARWIIGRDGRELIQLRVDLGVMQMFPDGRPDGGSYRQAASVRAYVEQALRQDRPVQGPDWQELERELLQTNYRRLAFASLVEESLGADDTGAARRAVTRALRDIAHCLGILELLCSNQMAGSNGPALRLTLLFEQARLAAQLGVIDECYDTAIEQLAAGLQALDTALGDLGVDPDDRARDPRVRFLVELDQNLRQEYGIPRTLREQLEQALQDEDFETAAQLRDELQRRDRTAPDEAPPPDET